MIDLSVNSEKVLKWAAEDALEHKSNLLILYPYRLKFQRDGEQRPMEKKQLEAEAIERFEKLKSTLTILKKVPHIFMAEVGFETDRLEVHMHKADLHVMVLSKEMAIAGVNDNDWNNFMKRLTIPIVLVP